jgi:AcrR family transcriptional regulator
MPSKSENTKHFILETVAPLFNQKGYSATSLSDITNATNLTKGAIYGNFKNKENLAVEAFNFNIRFTINKISDILDTYKLSIDKLFAITDFYKNHYKQNKNFGGCPILNVGVDAQFNNPKLFNRVKVVSLKLQKALTKIITDGINSNEINPNINPEQYGGRIFAIIEGAIFTTVLHQKYSYLADMMNYLENMIDTELRLD